MAEKTSKSICYRLAPFAQGRNPPFRMALGELLTEGEIREITDAGSLSLQR
jgi:hypothetical protein